MPRYARTKCEKHVYHVMLRGNNKEKIFIDEEDKVRIIETLREKKKDAEYYLHAYCVMDNHIHLIIKEGKDLISRTVKRIAGSYAYYFNKKYKRIGHVFQERFKSENIEDDRYLLTAIRYVHQNPVKAGIGSIEGYNWSSYRDYLEKGRKISDTSEILSIISNSHKSALTEFLQLNHEITEEVFLDIEEAKEIDESNVAVYVNAYLDEKRLVNGDLRSTAGKSAREELVRHLLKQSNLSLRGIAAVLGLNREMVRKAALSKDLSP